MFFLYHHNDLGRLAELFGALRDRNRPAPLATDTVLVPNRGVGRWLTIRLAERDGIAANVEAALPGGYIWGLLKAVTPEAAPHGRHFEPDALPWHLYLALPQMAREIAAVADYLGDPVDEVRRWQLARRLADVFDRYLIYRADMLAAWERGDTPTDNPGRWQARVWRYLTDDKHLGHDHRARVLADFIGRLKRDRDLRRRVVGHCPRALYCFGLVAPAPDQLRLLYALAEHIDVHFLLPNPSEAYWGDITAGRLPLVLPDAGDMAARLPGETAVENGHPLLAALGRMARDTLRLLYSDEFAGMIEPELGQVMAYEPPGSDSLLHRIQSDIVTLDCSDPTQGMDDDDTSLEIHACHSPLREIQVLQDQLLDRLAADDKRVAAGEIAPEQRLAPRDIIVMLPDVATYAPAIEAVFGGAPADRYLPFGLADRARSAAHPIVACIAALLDLPLWRWQASELLDLLAVPAIMRRFGIDAGELATITRWAQAAGIRWGRDASHRAQLGAGDFGQNSWRFGLDRLLLGVAQSDDETLIAGVAPWSDLEGSATDALGKLWRFERTLAETAEALAEAATPGNWQTRLNALVDALVAPAPEAPDEQRAVDRLRQVFARLEAAEASTADANIHASDDRRVSWPAMRDMLRAELGAAGEQQPFLAGGITFCGMVPLRAVPFRVVCVLGLNDGVFPREDNGRTFNVMYRQPRLGDRNTRDDDRLLFLQALTAARDAFYISYIGQDVHGGEILPPSPIVGETLEFVHRHYFRDWTRKAFDRRLIHQQPMQPFSLRYFSPDAPDPRVFTYAGDWRGATRAAIGRRGQRRPLFDDSTAALDEPVEAIDLDSLKRFFDDPPRAFFRERIKLDLELEHRQIDDAEPIVLDRLSAAQLRQRLFDSATAAGLAELPTEPSPLERARGMLPPAPLADVHYAAEAALVNELLPIWRAWQADGAPASIDIDLADIGGVRITGRVDRHWPGALRRLRTGKLKTKFRMRYWIDYLAVVAAGHDIALEMAGFTPRPKRMDPVRYAGRLDADAARAELARLVGFYVAGHRQPLRYHPALADDYIPEQSKAFENLGFRFKPAARNPHYLMNDPYFPLLLGDVDAPLGESADDSPFIAAIEAVTATLNATVVPLDETAPA